ncbi:MAG: FtsW/RodA/SpoVE family cell cycle protein [Ruminococcaceae bacterium]|nr:FtsW/RodA/SpoVE family cell cycle protein [Oscillospiraceae bacterium]MBQ6873684.1 FtsW/RodA/SpoVE family cell cycle protein [Clostridia bacterium]
MTKLQEARKKYKSVDVGFVLAVITVFQLCSSLPTIITDGKFQAVTALYFLAYIAVEWVYVFVMTLVFRKHNFEIECIAFFLCGLGMTITASIYPGGLKKQFIAILLGMAVYTFLVWLLKDVKRVMKLRPYIAVLAGVGLAASFVVIYFTVGKKNGAYNWMNIAGFSFQPSEIVKIAFVYVGAATLEKLQSSRSILRYLIFAVGCIGILFLMRDFGTALIFFFTFIVISFIRSGDIRSIAFICVGALLGAALIIYVKPTVASRFAVYRHVWENMDGAGYQQTRTMIYSLSGGLFGVGVGNGKLRGIFASTTDLIWGVICEEMGLITGLLVVLVFAFLAIYSIKISKSSPSTFYSIACVSTAAMLLFQVCLNIFGITDILPLTGVTLPFVSRGGSSMICSWGLIAFIKAADLRSYPKLYKSD